MARNRRKRKKVATGYNTHHILWQRRHWNSGYAKILREHDYMKVRVPVGTLHKEIHVSMADIPVPSTWLIKEAICEIDRLLKIGAISLDDPLTARLDLLIFMWDYAAPDTVRALRKQRQIAARYERQG